jgi:hypothetical protein
MSDSTDDIREKLKEIIEIGKRTNEILKEHVNQEKRIRSRIVEENLQRIKDNNNVTKDLSAEELINKEMLAANYSMCGEYQSLTKFWQRGPESEKIEALKPKQAKAIKDSKELQEQIASAIRAIEQEIWNLDYDVCDKQTEKILHQDEDFINAQIYWLKDLLSITDIRLKNQVKKQPKIQ